LSSDVVYSGCKRETAEAFAASDNVDAERGAVVAVECWGFHEKNMFSGGDDWVMVLHVKGGKGSVGRCKLSNFPITHCISMYVVSPR